MTEADRSTRFTDLYHTYVPTVRAFVRTQVPPSEVEPIVQATFETAWEKLEVIPILSQRNWLFGVARNHTRNHVRADRRRSNIVEAISAARPDAAVDLFAGGLDPGDVELLNRAFEQLSEMDREIVLLTVWYELDSNEIAHMLDITTANVRVRLHRARHKLGTLMASASERSEDAS